ncbi:uncharacterized protein LOC135109494 [Scylla paramamosain]|uniref:uncharacterized protein LOC135109494 n=1 Tax=Scylla paramamosain TaxID=85552 RepID=UPI003082FE6F
MTAAEYIRLQRQGLNIPTHRMPKEIEEKLKKEKEEEEERRAKEEREERERQEREERERREREEREERERKEREERKRKDERLENFLGWLQNGKKDDMGKAVDLLVSDDDD